VYPDLPKAGSYGYTVSEEDMFDYDRPMVEKSTDDFDLILRNACRSALQKGLVSDPEDLLCVTAGWPFGTPGAANIIRVVPAAGPSCWNGMVRYYISTQTKTNVGVQIRTTLARQFSPLHSFDLSLTASFSFFL
jgi:hypothetical protein